MPADDPEIVVYVAVDHPHNTVQYGGTVSAPIAKNVFKSAAKILNIKESNEVIPKEYLWLDEKYVSVPDVTGLNIKDAKKELRGFQIKYVGNGETIVKQMPKGSSMTKENGYIMLYLN